MKKVLQLLFACAAALSLCACGETKSMMETGIDQLEAQEYADAAATFGEALENRHWYDGIGKEDILLYRAEAFLGAQEYESALKIYEGLSEKKPKDGDLLYDRGLAQLALGQYEDAGESFVKAAKNGKEGAYEYAGRALWAGEDHAAAEEYYRKALEEAPENADLYAEIAVCLMNEEDYTGAIEILEQGIQKADSSHLQALLFHQAVCYEYMGQYDTARKMFADYVQQYPNDAAAAKEYEFLLSR